MDFIASPITPIKLLLSVTEVGDERKPGGQFNQYRLIFLVAKQCS